MDLSTVARYLLIVGSVSLLSCDPQNPVVKQLMPADKGLGLTRSSFGPLHPQTIPEGSSLCNENIGLGADKWLRDKLSWLVDKPRNTAGPVDPTLEKEELTKFFPLRNASSPLVRVISRNERSIDFWFSDDAVGYIYAAGPAAAEYCMNRNGRRPRYVGFAFRCGKSMQVPLAINGQMPSVREEEVIVAYDCIK